MAAIKNYGVNKKKICGICNLPVWNYVTCPSCGKFFCRKHKPILNGNQNWTCPKCSENIQAYTSGLHSASQIFSLIKIANNVDSDELSNIILDLLFREKL